MSRMLVEIAICDKCDEIINDGDESVCYPLALYTSIDLHAACADGEPGRGFTTAMAHKARERAVQRVLRKP